MILRGGDRLAMRVLGPADPGNEHDRDLDRLSHALAAEDAVTAQARVEELVTIAVQKRQLDDVVFWQRVMFKARLIRARRGVVPPAGTASGETTC